MSNSHVWGSTVNITKYPHFQHIQDIQDIQHCRTATAVLAHQAHSPGPWAADLGEGHRLRRKARSCWAKDMASLPYGSYGDHGDLPKNKWKVLENYGKDGECQEFPRIFGRFSLSHIPPIGFNILQPI